MSLDAGVLLVREVLGRLCSTEGLAVDEGFLVEGRLLLSWCWGRFVLSGVSGSFECLKEWATLRSKFLRLWSSEALLSFKISGSGFSASIVPL